MGTPRHRQSPDGDPGQAGSNLIWTVAGFLFAVALCIWIARAI